MHVPPGLIDYYQEHRMHVPQVDRLLIKNIECMYPSLIDTNQEHRMHVPQVDRLLIKNIECMYPRLIDY